MKINWLSVGRVAAAMVGTVVPGVQAVESIAEQFGHLKGADKEDAVIKLVQNALIASEGLTGKDLLNDADVEAATRDVIKAVHALHVVIATKHPPAVAA